MTIESPCIGICTLNEHDQCMGCMRRLDEISAWSTLDDEQRHAILSQLDERARLWRE